MPNLSTLAICWFTAITLNQTHPCPITTDKTPLNSASCRHEHASNQPITPNPSRLADRVSNPHTSKEGFLTPNTIWRHHSPLISRLISGNTRMLRPASSRFNRKSRSELTVESLKIDLLATAIHQKYDLDIPMVPHRPKHHRHLISQSMSFSAHNR